LRLISSDARRGAATRLAVPTMRAVAVVHEQVHERAGQEQQVWQNAEGVGVVLPQDVEGRDEAEADQGDSALGRHSGIWGWSSIAALLFSQLRLTCFASAGAALIWLKPGK